MHYSRDKLQSKDEELSTRCDRFLSLTKTNTGGDTYYNIKETFNDCIVARVP